MDAFTDAGADRVRVTGGEPLLRKNLPDLIQRLAEKPAIRDLALTTNGMLLAEQAAGLREAGLHRLTVSLDTLRADRFRELTRFDGVTAVQHGLDAARKAGFADLKIDTVVIRGVNDDELIDLLGYGRQAGAEVRFIEYMDVGGATRWSVRDVLSRAEMLRTIADALGPVTAIEEESSAPADRFRLPGGQTFGIISSTTEPFCRSCDRSRLTADGLWYRCLYAREGTDLRGPLRAGMSRVELTALIDEIWGRPQRPGGRGPARRRRPPAVHPDRDTPEGTAPGDAHAGWVGRAAQVQFSTFKSGTRPNSPALFVTRVASTLRAWAAISRSFAPMGRPRFTSTCRISP